MASYLFPSVKTTTIFGESYLPRSVDLASTTNVNLTVDWTTITIDGVTPVPGYRILLKNQTAASFNGTYECIAGIGNATKTFDMMINTNAAGLLFIVTKGVTNANTGWICSNAISNAVVGTDNITFVKVISQDFNGDLTLNTTQTLTNKDFSDVSNISNCNQLIAPGGSIVTLVNAAAPTINQVLTKSATGLEINWQNLTGTASGEKNTASSVGTLGIGLFAQKVGVDLQFRSLAATGVATTAILDAPNNHIGLSAVPEEINWLQAIGPLNSTKGGTGISVPTANSVFVSNGSGGVTFKARPNGAVLLTTGATTTAVTNKVITDPSNTLVRVSSILSGGSDVSLTITGTVAVGATLYSSSATAASIINRRHTFTDFVFAVSEAESTTTLTTDTQKLQLSCNTVASNTYEIYWYAEVFADTPSTTVNRSVTITHNTTNTIVAGYLAQNYADWVPFFGTIRQTVTVTSAAYPIRIFFRSGTAGVTTRIRRARLYFHK